MRDNIRVDKDGMRVNHDGSAGSDLSSRRRRCHGSMGRAVFGVAILMAGAILTLDNLGAIDADNFWELWPVLLIMLGASHLFAPRGSRKIGWGLFWSAAGVVLLMDNYGMIRFDVWELWPVVLIFVGGNILWQVFRPGQRAGKHTSHGTDSGEFDIMAALAGVSRRINSSDFKGGSATAIMGGCELDLRDATIRNGPVEIELFSFWGGIQIRVPQEWDIHVKGTAIMGGYEDKTAGTGDGSQVLILTGTVFMAGVEI